MQPHTTYHPAVVSCLGFSLVPSPPLTRVASWWSLLCCRLRLPSIVHVVVVGVLLGIGHTVVLLIETSLVFLKFKEEKKLTSGTGR
jgi:hypothetical protein